MGDLIGVVEAAYAVERDEYGWLLRDDDRGPPAPLVAGRWSVIERGSRLVVRENAPDAADPREAYAALGHSPALVAYELGD